MTVLSQILAVAAYARCLCSICGGVTMRGDHALCAGERIIAEQYAELLARQAYSSPTAMRVMMGEVYPAPTFSTPEWSDIGD